MKEYGRFGDFNVSNERKIKDIISPLIKTITEEEKSQFIQTFKASYPNIYLLLTDTTSYYEAKFDGLINKISREKRKMEFETPNRVLLTYEYELEGNENKQDADYLYLFNTRDRLSWLTINVDGENIAVASQKQVKRLLLNSMKNEIDELTEYLGIDKDTFVDFLYDNSDGKPCFIFGNSSIKSIKICYYDSVQEPEGERSSGIKFFHPIVENQIKYTYRTLAPISNCWFYTRAPKDFNLEVNYPKGNVDIDEQASQDPEISSMVIKGKKERQNVPLTINVKVPDGLKWWYNSIYWTSIITILVMGILICSHFADDTPPDLIEKLLKNSGNGIFALIAALITTRGWLMNEAHAFNFLSKAYTCFVITLMLEAFIMGGLTI